MSKNNNQNTETNEVLENTKLELTPEIEAKILESYEKAKMEAEKKYDEKLAKMEAKLKQLESKDKLSEEEENRIAKQNERIAKTNEAKILSMVQEIEKDMNGLDDSQKEAVMSELFKEIGMDYSAIAKALADNTLEPSKIFNNLGWFPIEQVIQTTNKNYLFTDLIPQVNVENGMKLSYVTDYLDGDSRKAYLKADYQFDPIHNPDSNEADYETYRTTRNFHKGYWIPSSLLNDITRSTYLYYAITRDVLMNIVIPLQKELYKLRLNMIADLLFDDSEIETTAITPTDWDETPIDIEITGADGYEATANLISKLNSLETTSRQNIPERYKFKNLSRTLEAKINLDDYVLLNSIEFQSYLEVLLKSPRFNQQNLDLPVENRAIDYNKTFVEYNQDTNVLSDPTTKCYMRLVPKRAHEIITHYQAVKSLENVNLSSVIHSWMRYAKYIAKTKPIYNISWEITAPTTVE